jgi:exportin-1
MRFKVLLRDFLVQLREFSGDNAELYIDEKVSMVRRTLGLDCELI